MGCGYSREYDFPSEEIALITAQKGLQMDCNSCIVVSLSFQEYSFAGTINHSQWQDLASKLELRFANGPDGPDIEGFYAAFKQGELLETKPLLVASLMMSAGLPRQKLGLLCDLYTRDAELIHQDTLRQIVADMIDVALRKLPLLLGTVQPAVKKYLDRLQAAEEVAQRKLVRKLIGVNEFDEDGCIQVQTLLDLCSKNPQSLLFTPHGLRGYMAQLSA